MHGVSAFGQKCGRIEQILPVDPGAKALHDFLVDARLEAVQRLLLQLHRFRVILPAFVVMEILFESFTCLSVHRLVCYIRILLVAGALVVLGAVILPVTQTHPAEIVFTVVALHMIAAAILLDADIAFGAIFSVCAYIISSLAVVSAFSQPLPYYLAIGRGVVVGATFKAKRRIACFAGGFFGRQVSSAYDNLVRLDTTVILATFKI